MSETVRRYRIVPEASSASGLRQEWAKSGPWVKFEDFARVRKALESRLAENDKLCSRLIKIDDARFERVKVLESHLAAAEADLTWLQNCATIIECEPITEGSNEVWWRINRRYDGPTMRDAIRMAPSRDAIDAAKAAAQEDENDPTCDTCFGSGGGPDPPTACRACGGSGLKPDAARGEESE